MSSRIRVATVGKEHNIISIPSRNLVCSSYGACYDLFLDRLAEEELVGLKLNSANFSYNKLRPDEYVTKKDN